MKKRIFSIIICVTLIGTVFAMTGCADKKVDEEKETIISQIESIKENNYLKEDQDKIKKLKEETIDKIEKAKTEEIEDILKDFNEKLAKIPDRKSLKKAMEKEMKESIKHLKGEDKEKAEKIIEEATKNGEVKNKEDLEKIAKSVATKITETTGKEVDTVKVTEVKDQATNIPCKPVVKPQPKPDKKPNNQETKPSKPSVKPDSKPNKPATKPETKPDKKPNKPSKPSHKHNWKPVYKTVHHQAKGHYETIEAWDEPIYKYAIRSNYDHSKLFYSYDDFSKWDDEMTGAPGYTGGYTSGQWQVGTKHHEAEQIFIPEEPAWDEEVIDHYECDCGKTKK